MKIAAILKTKNEKIKEIKFPIPDEKIPDFRDGFEFEAYDTLIELKAPKPIEDIIHNIDTVEELNNFAKDLETINEKTLMKLRKKTDNIWDLWFYIRNNNK